jgi:hypothetical protein
VNIFDRFLALAGSKILTNDLAKQTQIPIIITTVTIMAAKLEQPMTPSINRMIKLLTPEEEKHVDKAKVITMEATIIRAFNFDFGFLSPLPFIERFLRLLDHAVETQYNADEHKLSGVTCPFTKPSTLLHPVAVDLLKFVFSKSELFWGRPPSILAASILLLAQKIVRGSPLPPEASPYSLKWLSAAGGMWDAKMSGFTGIKPAEFEETAAQIEHAYKANGGGNAQILLFQ